MSPGSTKSPLEGVRVRVLADPDQAVVCVYILMMPIGGSAMSDNDDDWDLHIIIEYQKHPCSCWKRECVHSRFRLGKAKTKHSTL